MRGRSSTATTCGGGISRRHRLAAAPALAMILAVLLSSTAQADAPAQPDAAHIALGLRKLGVLGSVLYVAAHPDDENTNLLAYLANDKLLRTAYLSLTRGDGGQNLIGSEQGAELGVIRTQELLAARRIDGAQQFFTRALDFGYAKHADETLRTWDGDGDAVLADVVQVIRRFRPDVIISRFSPEASDTHGHHTASAQLALAAFTRAADASFHPEQLGEEARPWQARRLLWNRSKWNVRAGEDMSEFIALDVNGYNPLLGRSYGEIAAEARSMHKSQGFGVAPSRAPIVEYFKPLAESAPGEATTLLGGLDLSWRRLPGTAKVSRLVEKAQRELRPSAPHELIPLLLQIDAALADVEDRFWRLQKQAEVRDLILACAGLYAEAAAADFRVVPGGDLAVTVSAINRSPARITWRGLRVLGGTLADGGSAELRVDKPLGSVTIKQTLRVPPSAPLTTPYWLASPPEGGRFRIADPAMIGQPTAPPALAVELTLEVGDRRLTVRRPVVFKWTDPVAGERTRAVEVTPLVSVTPRTTVLVLPNGEARALAVRLVAGAPRVNGELRLEAPPGFSVAPTTAPFNLPEKGSVAELTFRLQARLPAEPDATATGTLRVVADVGGRQLAQGVEHIVHEHIPIEPVVKSSDVHLVALSLAREAGKLAYIPGPGDEVAACLRQAGYDVTELDDEALTALRPDANALGSYRAIVVGVRAFNTREPLRRARPALMAYVQGGGTLVVQYNTNNVLAPLTVPIGPFPFEVGRERVTDEHAAVTFLAPDSPLLTRPNPISERDFDGWVQERGLYFASTWDAAYQPVLSMHDPDEPPQSGSLLWARYGHGAFVYTGLSFFRQLPAGVPGAYRLFANLLAAGESPHAR